MASQASKLMRTIVHTDKAGSAIGPYSQAVKANGTVYVSGQIALGPDGKLVSPLVEEQTDLALQKLGMILKEAGSDYSRCLKCTIYLRTMDDFGKVNSVYEKYFTDGRPARACVAVAGLPKDALVEIDAIALCD